MAHTKVSIHKRSVALALAASLLFTACGSATSETAVDTEPSSEGTSTNAPVQEVAIEPDTSRVVATWNDPGENEIQLLVSNQSTVDTSANLTFEVDGVVVIAQRFETGDQHNFFAFNVNGVEPGTHTITVRSDDDHEHEVVFEKTADPVWIVLHYWPEQSDTGFFEQIEDEPVDFA